MHEEGGSPLGHSCTAIFSGCGKGGEHNKGSPVSFHDPAASFQTDKGFEEELEKQLLVRGSKKVTLTEDGLLLRKRAEELVELMEKTKAELTASQETINGEIYIGCGETESISFLA